MKVTVTPDGARYLRMAQGRREPLPFHLRWLLPYLCGASPLRWSVACWAGLVGTAAGVAVLAHSRGLPPERALAAALLWAGLPSVRFLASRPVLVDAPGLALAVWAAVSCNQGTSAGIQPPGLAVIALSLVAACCWERAPIFAALFAGSPWPLVGALAPALRMLWRPAAIDPQDPLADTLRHPLATGLAWHKGHWRNPLLMLAPWGACVAALAAPDPWLLGVLGAAYGQLLLATDSVRLYQQAAPLVCVVAAGVIPESWLWLAVALHWTNPWAGDGI